MHRWLFLHLLLFSLSGYSQDTSSVIRNKNTHQPVISDSVPSFKPGASTQISISNVHSEGVNFTEQLLIGQVPGLFIKNIGGNKPVPDLEMNNRGISSMYGNSDLLYVIDGIPHYNPDHIMPTDIASIKVLRSASELMKYGIKGSDGVVEITTNKGQPGRPVVSYSGYGYMETDKSTSQMLSGSQWRQVKQTWLNSDNTQMQFDADNMDVYRENTHWTDLIMQQKISQAHNLSIKGGFNNSSYYASFNYRNLHGLIKNTNNRVYNGRFLFRQLAFNNKLEVNASLGMTDKGNRNYDNHSFMNLHIRSKPNLISVAQEYNPTFPDLEVAYNNLYENLTTQESEDYLFLTAHGNTPKTLLDNYISTTNNQLFYTDFQVNYEILKGLDVALLYSQQNSLYEDERKLNGITNLSYEKTTITSEQSNRSHLLEGMVNYSFSLNNHHFTLQSKYSEQIREHNYEENYTHTVDSIDQTKKRDLRNNTMEPISSVLANLEYNYNHKYYLSAGMLHEKSQFYPSTEPANYVLTSLLAGWRLDQEKFFRNASWIDLLSLRFSYGNNQREVDYDKIENIPLTTSVIYDPIENESFSEINIGIDLETLANRIHINLNYYNNTTTNGILLQDIAWSVGAPSNLPVNTLEIQNQGIEANLSVKTFVSQNFNWSTNFNYFLNINSVGNFASYEEYHQNDHVIGNIEGYRFTGFTETGSVIFTNKEGNITNNPTSLQVIGNAVPRSGFGLINYLTFRNFDLSVKIRGLMGFDLLNDKRTYVSRNNNMTKDAFNADPRLFTAIQINRSSYYVEQADFVKIDKITFGYNYYPTSGFFQKARIYIALKNVLTLTEFTGWDPEMVRFNPIRPGIYSDNEYFDSVVTLAGINLVF